MKSYFPEVLSLFLILAILAKVAHGLYEKRDAAEQLREQRETQIYFLQQKGLRLQQQHDQLDSADEEAISFLNSLEESGIALYLKSPPINVLQALTTQYQLSLRQYDNTWEVSGSFHDTLEFFNTLLTDFRFLEIETMEWLPKAFTNVRLRWSWRQ